MIRLEFFSHVLSIQAYPLPLIFSLQGREKGQASSEDLLPLGYGERDRVRVRVNLFITHF
jgi:hypothetical protein